MTRQRERAHQEQRAEHRRRARQDRRAGAGAERRLAARATKRRRDVAALALLQQHDHQQQQADEHVQDETRRSNIAIQYTAFSGPPAALRLDLEETPHVEAGAADQRAVTSGKAD